MKLLLCLALGQCLLLAALSSALFAPAWLAFLTGFVVSLGGWAVCIALMLWLQRMREAKRALDRLFPPSHSINLSSHGTKYPW